MKKAAILTIFYDSKIAELFSYCTKIQVLEAGT